ncbi:MAG TPA: glutamyl-tRNA reductase [Pseudomonadales bacterium]
MALIALGINHNTAAVALREKVAIAPERMPHALTALCRAAQVPEAMILSTCNRTEIIAAADDVEHCSNEILHWLASSHDLSPDVLSDNHYVHREEAAILHMMKVASGLDSMILGEPQILGQMKSAYAVAQEAGTVGSQLMQAMQHTFAWAKRVRTQTAIGQNPVSVAFAAVHLSQRIFSDLGKSTALLIGAGDTIDLVARHLREKHIGTLLVANRTLARAQQLASQYQAEAILLPDISERLAGVDIVISSTASQLPILGKGAVEKALKKRRHRPMFMVDIAVPRDIEPEVAELRDVYLYTVDDLRDIIDENKKARQDEVAKADVILYQGVDAWRSARRMNDVAPLLRAFREQAENIKQQELERALKQLAAGHDAADVLGNMARLLTNKLIHAPSANLKKAAESGQHVLVSQFASLYELPQQPDGNDEP